MTPSPRFVLLGGVAAGAAAPRGRPVLPGAIRAHFDPRSPAKLPTP